jgi:hypothetical protein
MLAKLRETCQSFLNIRTVFPRTMMSDSSLENGSHKAIVPDAKAVGDAPRRADGVSQLCMSLL